MHNNRDKIRACESANYCHPYKAVVVYYVYLHYVLHPRTRVAPFVVIMHTRLSLLRHSHSPDARGGETPMMSFPEAVARPLPTRPLGPEERRSHQ